MHQVSFALRVVIAIAAICLFGTSLRGDDQLLEKIDLLAGGQGGYVAYRIPGIVQTRSGMILAYCEGRKTGRGDWDSIDLLLCRSSDAGKTWSKPAAIGVVPGKPARNPLALEQKHGAPTDLTYNNPVAIADRDGRVHLVYCLEYYRAFYLYSADDGATWTEPVEITRAFDAFKEEYDWKVIATGPGHGIQLASGRLVVPVWLSLGTGGNAHRPSVTSTIYSDDRGKSWQRGAVAIPNTDEWINPNEAVVIELADGRVMLNARSESHAHRRLVVYSDDGATRWSSPRFDQTLLEPICMASIARVSKRTDDDRDRIIFANPHNLQRADGRAKPGTARDRQNLSVKLSYDEGATWPVDKALEEGPSAYSDLLVLNDGTILCFYERGRPGDEKAGKFYGLTLARFNTAWLTGGADSFERD